MSKPLWFEHAHLFANGKFKVKNDYCYVNNPDIIVRVNEDSTSTLIARSIDDMTDEEKKIHMYECRGVIHKSQLDSEPRFYETPESFLYLLSIGVLPPNFSEEGVEFLKK